MCCDANISQHKCNTNIHKLPNTLLLIHVLVYVIGVKSEQNKWALPHYHTVVTPLHVILYTSVTSSMMVEHLLYSIHSLSNNSIGDDGAKAISEAMKTLINLKELS